MNVTAGEAAASHMAHLHGSTCMAHLAWLTCSHKHTQTMCPTSLGKVSWNPGSSFQHSLARKSHQMGGVWDEEKVWETRGLRDLS